MRKTPVVLLVLSLFALMTSPATAATRPGGKTNFVVALGSFKAGTARDNWVRPGDHVKPMMQILDDDGRFHGWVGVEASFYPHTDETPRYHDMLSTSASATSADLQPVIQRRPRINAWPAIRTPVASVIGR